MGGSPPRSGGLGFRRQPGLRFGVGFPEPAPAQPGGGLAHALMRAYLTTNKYRRIDQVASDSHRPACRSTIPVGGHPNGRCTLLEAARWPIHTTRLERSFLAATYNDCFTRNFGHAPTCQWSGYARFSNWHARLPTTHPNRPRRKTWR